jgi:hypothetical protein
MKQVETSKNPAVARFAGAFSVDDGRQRVTAPMIAGSAG